MREREHDVHVRHIEQLALPRGQPALARLGLALGTVPIPTRIVRDGPMSAGAAVIDMPAEGGGPTPPERAQHGALLHAEPRMSFDESVTLRVEDIGHLHGGPAHDCGGFRSRRDRGTTGGGVHVQLVKRNRRGVEVPSREVEIHRRVRQVGVAQQQLNRAHVGPRFQQMRRVRVPQRVRGDALVDPGLPCRQAHGLPDHLRGDRRIGTPAVARPGKEIGPRPHPAVVLAQGREERGTERDLAIATALALFDAEHHPLAIDVAHFQLAGFAAAEPGTVQRQQERAVIEILGAGNQALDFVGAEHDRQAMPLLRIRQVVTHVTSFQDVPAEEPQRADLGDHRPDGQASLLEEEQVVASELVGRDPIETRARLLPKRVNDLDVATDGRPGVVPTHQLVAQALQ